MTPSGSVEVVGHGGAGAYAPGNSRRAIDRALQIGVDRIECDVQPSIDGTLVLAHDETVLLDGVRLPVRALTVEQLRRALDGLLTLDELLELVGTRASLLLDLKAPSYEPAVADAIARHAIRERTVVSSTYAPSLRRLRSLVPGLSVGLSSGHLAGLPSTKRGATIVGAALARMTARPLVATARWVGADHLMLHHRLCLPRMIDAARASGLRVYPWTVDDDGRMGDLIELGVDGIISNRPDILKGRLAEVD